MRDNYRKKMDGIASWKMKSIGKELTVGGTETKENVEFTKDKKRQKPRHKGKQSIQWKYQ